jgi:hypothetical protein
MLGNSDTALPLKQIQKVETSNWLMSLGGQNKKQMEMSNKAQYKAISHLRLDDSEHSS